MSIDFVTFCCSKDIRELHKPGVFRSIVESHQQNFDNVFLVYQRCEGIERDPIDYPGVITLKSEDHPMILTEFGLPEHDGLADHYTHGPSAPHYWKWHVINHLIGLKHSTSDYIVFSDCDCFIKQSIGFSWTVFGRELLSADDSILIVSPGDGGLEYEAKGPDGVRMTQNISQQLFLIERRRMLEIDFDIPWNWEFLAPGEPMQEYYYMLEGRLWRYMHRHNLWRAFADGWRYWHTQTFVNYGE